MTQSVAGTAAATARRFARIKTGPLKAQIADELRTAIFNGELRPGDPLVEMHLAREFGVSQVSVREALVQLEQLGLVIRIPNKGTMVTVMSEKAVSERIAIRAALEGLASVAAAPSMNEDDFEELELRVKTISAAASRNAYFEAAQADLEFHRYIWRKSGNDTLYQMLDQITAPLFAFVSIRRSSDLEMLERVISNHQNVINVLRTGDPVRIRDTMRSHAEASYEQFTEASSGDTLATG